MVSILWTTFNYFRCIIWEKNWEIKKKEKIIDKDAIVNNDSDEDIDLADITLQSNSIDNNVDSSSEDVCIVVQTNPYGFTSDI